MMVFVSLFLDLYFTETILFLVPLFLLLRLSVCTFTRYGKQHPLMNGYTMAVLMN
uniref:PsbA n=1 Tax=Angelica tsinlingensis TaxID=357858 RepID=A0A2L1K1B6_9APIA|nr:PsbA [Angelica tsinlingensis]